MGDRYSRVRHLNILDPAKDCHEIHHGYARQEFPWDYGRGLEVALLKACCVPEISEALAESGHFTRAGQKRYDDTRILLGEIVAHGFDSPRGRQSISQINRAHHGFDLANEDMLFVLSTFVFEPIRWIDEWAWRATTPAERLGSFHFFAEIGRRMGVKDLPTDHDSFLRFNLDYEKRRFRYAATNANLGRAVLGVYSSWYRAPIRALVSSTLLCRLDEPARAALGLPEPGRLTRAARTLGLRTHAAAELLLPRTTARLFARPAARSYPHGYDLADIGARGEFTARRQRS
ncbi:oxygenase MpaB family protein [Allokutzneria sp. NRRL B-24872]|uniref:oxygenase MpaB family protein n=1 Tax=Allokutzneria sp. NRRL B-24872 TaxID=1137961 RepID=UPI000A3C9A88|nr:oxygenase MpaB family protein [Allokutzneria sp. NRRL B-24872]